MKTETMILKRVSDGSPICLNSISKQVWSDGFNRLTQKDIECYRSNRIWEFVTTICWEDYQELFIYLEDEFGEKCPKQCRLTEDERMSYLLNKIM